MIAAIVMFFSLLFAQLAVAAYACPVQERAPTMAASACADMNMDMGSPALCAAHCEPGQQSADISVAPAVQAFVPCSLEVVLVPIERATLAPGSSHVAPLLTHATSPPLAIRHCCFRI